jgi:translation elongation factor EF-1alpha
VTHQGVESSDELEVPPRLIDKPLRMIVTDVSKGGLGAGASGSATISGKIDQGNLQVGETLLMMPARETCTVKSIEVGDVSALWAAAGDQVLVTITGIDPMHLT